MSDDEDCCVVKPLAQRSLDQVFSLNINLCVRFIKDKDSCLTDDRSGEAKQLLLPDREEIVALGEYGV